MNFTTSLINGTETEILSKVHNNLVIPNLITLYLVTAILTLIVGMLSTSTADGKRRFMWIWFISLVLSGIVVAILVLWPNLIIDFISQLKK